MPAMATRPDRWTPISSIQALISYVEAISFPTSGYKLCIGLPSSNRSRISSLAAERACGVHSPCSGALGRRGAPRAVLAAAHAAPQPLNPTAPALDMSSRRASTAAGKRSSEHQARPAPTIASRTVEALLRIRAKVRVGSRARIEGLGTAPVPPGYLSRVMHTWQVLSPTKLAKIAAPALGRGAAASCCWVPRPPSYGAAFEPEVPRSWRTAS